MFPHLLQNVFWAAAPLAQFFVVALMIWRKLYREYPYFLVYTAFHVAKSGFLYLVLKYGTYPQYFYAYWLSALVSVALGLLVIQEIYRYVFRDYPGLQHLGVLLFRWSAIVLVLVAFLLVFADHPTEPDPIVAGVLICERSVRIVQGGLLLFLFFLSSYLRLTLRHCATGIGLGLALFVSVDVVAVAVRIQLGRAAADSFSLVHGAAYSCAIMIWMAYLLVPERRQNDSQVPLGIELDQWNRALLELLQR